MSDQWYYASNGQKHGPVSGIALKGLAANGQIAVTDLVWREGLAEWTPASKVKGLFPEAVAATSPPPLPASAAIVASAPEANLDERYGSFYCSSDDRVVLGFAGGLAHKFGVPPAAMRVIILFVPFGLIAYIAAFFLPKLPTKGVPRPA